jgi:hypothetical protein
MSWMQTNGTSLLAVKQYGPERVRLTAHLYHLAAARSMPAAGEASRIYLCHEDRAGRDGPTLRLVGLLDQKELVTPSWRDMAASLCPDGMKTQSRFTVPPEVR